MSTTATNASIRIPQVQEAANEAYAQLFSPYRLGSLELKNRMVLAPMTRSRAIEGNVPNPLAETYYAQRAGAGLIVTEATQVSPRGQGYIRTPGIHSEAQVAGWKKITDAVHKAGGKIFVQLWHVGRVSHPDFHHGELPVAPSAIDPAIDVYTANGPKKTVTPHALTATEIKAVVEDFRQAAENAKRAGFDGVEIHGANGYLLDQFLQDSTNRRTDSYGGPIENRARLLLEVVDACIDVWGADRVGLHLAPRGDAHTMGDSNPLATFGYVAEQTGQRGIAFLCAREHEGADSIGPQLKKIFGGVFIANEKFTKETAEAAITSGRADAVAFGQLFIANPDLPERFKLSAPLNAPDPATFYAQGSKGYTDYPYLERAETEA